MTVWARSVKEEGGCSNTPIKHLHADQTVVYQDIMTSKDQEESRKLMEARQGLQRWPPAGGAKLGFGADSGLGHGQSEGPGLRKVPIAGANISNLDTYANAKADVYT